MTSFDTEQCWDANGLDEFDGTYLFELVKIKGITWNSETTPNTTVLIIPFLSSIQILRQKMASLDFSYWHFSIKGWRDVFPNGFIFYFSHPSY